MFQRAYQFLPVIFGYLAHRFISVQIGRIQYRANQRLGNQLPDDFLQTCFAEFLGIPQYPCIQFIFRKSRLQIKGNLQFRPVEMLQPGYFPTHGKADRPGDSAPDELQLAEFFCHCFPVCQHRGFHIFQGQSF